MKHHCIHFCRHVLARRLKRMGIYNISCLREENLKKYHPSCNSKACKEEKASFFYVHLYVYLHDKHVSSDNLPGCVNCLTGECAVVTVAVAVWWTWSCAPLLPDLTSLSLSVHSLSAQIDR